MASKARPRNKIVTARQKALPRISQFLDMPLKSWQSRSCGVAALATIVEFYTGEKISLRTHFKNARAAGAYMPDVGWRHKELASLAKQYNLAGTTFDWAKESDAAAWKNFKATLKQGPVIASIYKDFKVGNGGHLIPVQKLAGDLVYYNEPAAKTRHSIARTISIGRFRTGWKKRILVVRPLKNLPL